MDWARAKIILITVFLIANTILAYTLYGNMIRGSESIDSEKLQEVISYLADKNIEITGSIPSRKVNLPSITVRYKLFKANELAGILLAGEGEVVPSGDEKELLFQGSSKSLKLNYGRELHFLDNSVAAVSGAIDESQCKKNIQAFLKKLNIDYRDKNLMRIESAGGYCRFIYEQKYKGYTIYNSGMEFYVNGNGIHQADIVWFDSIKPAGNKTEVISPVIAMLRLSKHYEDSGSGSIKISNIEQGYYFSTGLQEQVDISKIEGGTAFPVWALETPGETLYINGYNEKIENVKKAY